METRYIEIFATKGAEYIFVIGFLLLLIFFWRFLNAPGKPRNAGTEPAGASFLPNPQFRIAEGYFYHQGHSWAVPERQDVARVGIDDFAQQLLGEPAKVDLPQIGSRIEQGEKAWKLWIDSKSVDILSPVEGEVVAVNTEAIQTPALLNRDPYGSGWLVKVKIPNINKNLRNLMSGDLAMVWMKETADALEHRIQGSIGKPFKAASAPFDGIARNFFPDNWDKFAAKFLSGN